MHARSQISYHHCSWPGLGRASGTFGSKPTFERQIRIRPKPNTGRKVLALAHPASTCQAQPTNLVDQAHARLNPE